MRSEVRIFPDPPSFRCVLNRAEVQTLTQGALCEKGVHSRKLDQLGAIAQLGEHLLCKQGVGGSIPPGSTILPMAGGGAAVDEKADAKIRFEYSRLVFPDRQARSCLRLFKNLGSCERREIGFSQEPISSWVCCIETSRITQVAWGYMVKRISAYGGCLGDNWR